MYLHGNIRIDLNNNIWVDVYDANIYDIQRACLMGGTLIVYHLINDEYRLGFTYNEGKISIQFIGVTLTQQQFETQTKLWGKNYKIVAPGTELLLLDNQYFL